MREDPIVAEVHRIRAEIMAECDNDLKKYFEMLKAGEREHPERMVSPEEFRRRHPKKKPAPSP
jgi:hypothetical protein